MKEKRSRGGDPPKTKINESEHLLEDIQEKPAGRKEQFPGSSDHQQSKALQRAREVGHSGRVT